MHNAASTTPLRPTADELRSLDPDAWETLYLQARPVLWQFARSRLATAEQTEDALSETMVRAMSAIGRFREGRVRHRSDSLMAWLIGIERNVVNEIYRSGRRLRSVPVEPEMVEPGIGDGIIAAEEVHALRLAFARLPTDDQELLGLRVIAGLDSTTTALALGKRPGAIRMAQARALGRLRVTLIEADRD